MRHPSYVKSSLKVGYKYELPSGLQCNSSFCLDPSTSRTLDYGEIFIPRFGRSASRVSIILRALTY